MDKNEKKDKQCKSAFCFLCINKIRIRNCDNEHAVRNYYFSESEEFMIYKYSIGEKTWMYHCVYTAYVSCNNYNAWKNHVIVDLLEKICQDGNFDNYLSFLRHKISHYDNDCTINATIASILAALVIGVSCLVKNVDINQLIIAVFFAIVTIIFLFIRSISLNNLKKNFFKELLRIAEEYYKIMK